MKKKEANPLFVDLVFINENIPEDNVSVIKNIKSQRKAIKKFQELDKTTKIEYAYLRRFSGWHYSIVKWLKRKDKS